MGYRQGDETYSFEGKVEFVTEKSRLVDILIEGKYWLPKKCTIEMEGPDPDGNCWFIVTEWWYNKRHDFKAEDKSK